jgi:hypothetical protein
MIIDSIHERDRFKYEQKCQCGKIHIMLTQEDNDPEYHTRVYVLCDCGQYVEFNLPVN